MHAVERCAIGGQAFYFYARFLYTKELDEIDFSKNSDWFNIKLCTDCRTQNNTTGLNDKTYYKSIKSACEKLSIPSKHFIHFGRSCGSVLAELEELDRYNINDLGNWNVDTRRDVYSAKLPMKAMRVMAGHSEQKGSVFVARDQVIPAESLQLQVFPFLEKALGTLQGHTVSHPTAMSFLSLLKRLRIVLLQDAAEMIVIGRSHVIFTNGVFKSNDFLSFVEDMRHHLNHVRNPQDVQLETVLPGVNERFNSLHADLSGKFSMLQTSMTHIATNMVTANHIQAFANHVGAFDMSQVVGGNSNNNKENGNEQDAEVSSPPLFSYILFSSHKSCRSVWHEWYGKLYFDSNSNSSCYKGGIEALESDYKSSWRASFSPAEQKRFSRLKMIITRLRTILERNENKITPEDLLTYVDGWYSKSNENFTVAGFDKKLKKFLDNGASDLEAPWN